MCIVCRCTYHQSKILFDFVMDEAVYDKAQVIRWRNEEIMNKVVIRLGAYHTVMSYCSGISKIFKDAGLQVSVILSKPLYQIPSEFLSPRSGCSCSKLTAMVPYVSL